MEREGTNQERLERPGSQLGEELADAEATGPDEDWATGSEGAGRLIGLGEHQRSRRRDPGSPGRLPD